MNRPSTIYTGLPDKHYKSNVKILAEFARIVREKLENPEGIILPIGFFKVVRHEMRPQFKQKAIEHDVEGFTFANDHTDGFVFSVKAAFRTNSLDKDYVSTIPFMFYKNYKMFSYRNLKRVARKAALSENWTDYHIKYKE